MLIHFRNLKMDKLDYDLALFLLYSPILYKPDKFL